MGAVRFLFDDEFGQAGGKAGPSDAALQRACAEAEARGVARGRAEAAAEAERAVAARTAVLLDRIAAAAAPFFSGLEAERARLESEATALGIGAAKRLAPALLSSEPLVEVAALVAQCVGLLGAAPHAVFRLSAQEAEHARGLLERLARDRGFEGRIVVFPDPELALGDCRIEWAEGGVSRSRTATEGAIDALVSQYLAARAARRSS